MITAALLLMLSPQTSIRSWQTHKIEHVGQCFMTTVKQVTFRQGEMKNGRYVPLPGSGSALFTVDGHGLYSEDQLPGIDQSRKGDRIRLCVADVPQGCKRGDTAGIGYKGENLRTKLRFETGDSSHLCDPA